MEFCLAIQLVDRIELLASAAGGDSGGIGQVKDGIGFAAKLNPLVLRVQKAVSPQTGVERLAPLIRRDQHDKGVSG